MNTDYIYHETAAWPFYHNDFSNNVVWLDGKPWDSQDSLGKVLEIFRLAEIVG